jgi:hypothetical protein
MHLGHPLYLANIMLLIGKFVTLHVATPEDILVIQQLVHRYPGKRLADAHSEASAYIYVIQVVVLRPLVSFLMFYAVFFLFYRFTCRCLFSGAAGVFLVTDAFGFVRKEKATNT